MLEEPGGVVAYPRIRKWLATAVFMLTATALAEAPAPSVASVQDAPNATIPALPRQPRSQRVRYHYAVGIIGDLAVERHL